MVITFDTLKLTHDISMTQKDMMQVDYIFVIGNDGQLVAHTFDGGFPPDLFTCCEINESN